MGNKQFLTIIGLLVLAGAAFLWQTQWRSQDSSPSDGVSASTTIAAESSNANNADEPKSPFALAGDGGDADSSTNSDSLVADNVAASNDSADAVNQNTSANTEPGTLSIDISSVGRSAISDEDFLAIAEQLRRDPALLQQLIDEFRQETDPARKETLSRLLGEAGGPDVTLAASELIYSGDPESRRLGLELLQQIQPDNAEARDIASTLLATEVEPEILVSTLTTLARPGTVEDESRDFLTDQVAFLTGHEDASVRSISINILSRWSQDGRHTETLRGGLSDTEAVVRESAAYSLVGYDSADQSVIDSLLSVAVNSNENTRARRGAILALKGMSISDIERQQVNDAETELDTVRR